MAVLVGCNYPNTEYELQGCINDVIAMKHMLSKRFGFDEKDIELLSDEEGSSALPTGANIKKALENMVDRAMEGDVLYFHYSGHGTLIPSLKQNEPHRKDEAIVPCDFNLITDMDFRQLVNKLPPKASFTVLSDSCHSGGLIDQEKEQIGPTTMASEDQARCSRPKFIPYDQVLQKLKQLTSIDTPNIGRHLKEHFKDQASLSFCLNKLDQAQLSLERATKDDYGILLSGCQSNETSADVSLEEGEGGEAHGAFSNAVQKVLMQNSGRLSNKEVVTKAREVLQEQLYKQHPCLYCSDENADATFLLQS
uniref:Peptidase C14 caspase domain-containing protein n=2 Tax=Chenopodium quinoa TaxID=63459 RepID=A0A803NB02_CHEQI